MTLSVSAKFKNGFSDSVAVKIGNFPAGESNIRLKVEQLFNCYNGGLETVKITWKFDSDVEFIQLALIVDAIRNVTNKPIVLFVPYFPYARQDRVCNEGEAFSIRVAVDFVKNLNFSKVIVVDPHSNVLQGMFPAGILTVVQAYEVFDLPDNVGQNITLIAPDEGSYKKTDLLYKQLRGMYPDKSFDVIHCFKKRNLLTGEILHVDTIEPLDFYYDTTDFIVADDICDGGRTFIELIKPFKEFKEYAVKFHLFVTHGIFSKGVDVLYEAGYDSVSCFNDMSN